jgi:hypothetical protein
MQPADINKLYNFHNRDITAVTPPTNDIFAISNMTLTTDNFANIGQ